MGLIKAAKDAMSTILADQWREYFYCDSLSNQVFMTKGQKRVTSGRNSNTKGVDNIITNGSVIAVNEGQCMIIVDQGQVVEVCADAGEFVYDASTEPSIFYGGLGENIKKSFSTFGKRFTFGGNTGKDQRVYYFNTKEVMDNLYGTANPIDFHLVSKNTGLELETTVRCNGQYSFKIVDPILFYTNVCANVTDSYGKDGEGAKLISMMKSELLTKLPMALSKVAAEGVLPSQLQGHIEEIITYVKRELSEKWTDTRGIEMVSMTISATVPPEDRERLNTWNERVLLRDADYRAARQSESMATFVENSSMGGGNGNGGASGMDAMMGMFSMGMMQNMMNNQGGMMGGQMGNPYMPGGAPQMQQTSPYMQQGAAQVYQNTPYMQQAPQNQQSAPHMQAPVLGWTCSCGHQDNRGKFCTECGSKKPDTAGWTCSCGAVNQGKFCTECGSKKPEGAPLYKCDKCGWEPEDPAHPPKFCPECSDVFDENDRK